MFEYIFINISILELDYQNHFSDNSMEQNRVNSTVSSKPTEAKQHALQGIEQNLPPPQKKTDATTFAFACLAILLLWYFLKD